ncbi:MAG: hypothetical protein IJR95_01585 [Lachnospiraceae bacterium]|nr:hypothetical protein [Lachnospiraceae bacterium]
MVQKDKLIIMTRLAMEEKKDSRLGFITRNYWFDDYMTLELWKAFFAVTITFGLTVLLGLIAYGDEWTVRYKIADVVNLGIYLLRIYLLVLVICLLLAALSHVWLYKKAYRKQEREKSRFRQLGRIYALEEALQNLNRGKENRSRGKE